MNATPERFMILLVDDDSDDALIIQRALSPTGAEIVCLPEGEEAIAYLAGQGTYADRKAWPLPNVVLLDNWMPRVSGLDVLSWIRTQPAFASLPVVLLSGGLAPGQQQTAERLGAAFCEKGVATDGLPKALLQAVNRAFTQSPSETSPVSHRGSRVN